MIAAISKAPPTATGTAMATLVSVLMPPLPPPPLLIAGDDDTLASGVSVLAGSPALVLLRSNGSLEGSGVGKADALLAGSITDKGDSVGWLLSSDEGSGLDSGLSLLTLPLSLLVLLALSALLPESLEPVSPPGFLPLAPAAWMPLWLWIFVLLSGSEGV